MKIFIGAKTYSKFNIRNFYKSWLGNMKLVFILGKGVGFCAS